MKSSSKNSLKLPSYLSDNMLLQQEAVSRISGQSKASATVKLEFAGATLETKADENGYWEIPLKTGAGSFESLTMTISSGKESISIKNILVGELWLCSGQSNMEMHLMNTMNGEEESDSANYPDLRIFKTAQVSSAFPNESAPGAWSEANSQTVRASSAVAYYFGRELLFRLNMPIGLIESSVGGTKAESWTPLEDVKSLPFFDKIIGRIGGVKNNDDLEKLYKTAAKQKGMLRHVDKGNKGFAKGWASTEFNDKKWESMDIPRYWETTGLDIDGSVWFRKKISIPASWKGKELLIEPGILDDFDTTYFNGEQIGATGMETPGWWTVKRKYTIPAKLVKAGEENLIAIRIFDEFGNGGFGGPADIMNISCPALNESVSITGEWKFKVETALKPMQSFSDLPATLYNGMIHPFTKLAIKGAIWYQGESNVVLGKDYAELFKAMIRAWRRVWDDDIVFLFVQLAGYGDNGQPDMWPILREAQEKALILPKTGMAVAIDIGEKDDIHPKNKKDVGKRLSLAARKIAYDEDIEYSGPTLDSLKISGEEIYLDFKNDAGLYSKTEQLKGFEVAGFDRVFTAASARIEKGQVIVTSPLEIPKTIRYAWTNFPECSLYNGAGLPAVPFKREL